MNVSKVMRPFPVVAGLMEPVGDFATKAVKSCRSEKGRAPPPDLCKAQILAGVVGVVFVPPTSPCTVDSSMTT